MVDLAEALLAAAAAVDAARHAAPRGTPASTAATDSARPMEQLRRAALDADAAARGVAQQGRIGRAAGLLRDAGAVALRGADAGAAETAALERLGGLDIAMDEATAGWDAPGSQSERRAALAALATELDGLAAAADAEQPVPEACPALRDHRGAWARLLAERTRTLEASATSATGAQYDQQRAAFAADPYGQDRLAADAADAECWAEHSVLAQAAAGIRDQVAALEALLQEG